MMTNTHRFCFIAFILFITVPAVDAQTIDTQTTNDDTANTKKMEEAVSEQAAETVQSPIAAEDEPSIQTTTEPQISTPVEPTPVATDTPETDPAAAVEETGNQLVNANDTAVVPSNEEESAMAAPAYGKQSGAAVFKRLRKTFAGPICNDTAAIASWKKRYAGNSKVFSNHLRDILPLLDYVSSEVERRKLPGEYALIPIIESRYQPHAIGVGGPAGLWQMIGSTAKNHGIKIQTGYDGRLSVIDSTDAALSYLKQLETMFHDWQRTAMGYNAGEFRVLRAIKNSPKHNGQDHWPNGLSHITYAYISKMQALSCVIAKPTAYGLTLPNDAQFTPLFVSTANTSTVSLEKLAQQLNVDAAKLKLHNAAYKNGVIGSDMPKRLLLPKLSKQTDTIFIADSKSEKSFSDTGDNERPQQPMSQSVHNVKSGDSLWSIAKHYGIALQTLRQLNGLGTNAVLRIGQQIKLVSSR